MLQLTLDQLTGNFRTWAGTAVPSFRRKFPSRFSFDLRFAVGSVAGALPDGAAIEVIVRRTSDRALLIKIVGAERVGEGAAAFYRINFATRTEATEPLFEDAELDNIPCRFEVRWQPSVTEDMLSATLPFTLDRAENEGDEPDIVAFAGLFTPIEVADEDARLALDPADEEQPLRFGQAVLQLDTLEIYQWIGTGVAPVNDADAWQPWRGPVGPVGPPNSLSIGTVTNGAPGTNAAAVVSGDAPNQVLDLTVPRGNDGAGASWLVRSASFTAAVRSTYIATATLTVADPTTPAPVAGDSYEVIVAAGVATIGGVPHSPDTAPVVRYHDGARWTALPTAARTVDAYAAIGGHVLSDGATSARAQVMTPGVAGSLGGASVVTWRGLVTMPVGNAPETMMIASVGPSAATSNTTTYALSISLSVSGTLQIRQGADTGNSRSVGATGFRAPREGTTRWLEVVLTAGTGMPVVRWDGVDVSSGLVDGSTGTPPPWLDSSLVSTYHLTGYKWQTGISPIGGWIIGTLSDADREFWDRTGQPPAWVAVGGSAGNTFAAGNSASLGVSDASVNLTTSANASTSVESGARPGGAGSYFVRATAAGTGTASLSITCNSYPIGRRLLVRGWIRSSVAQSVDIRFNVTSSTASTISTVLVSTSWTPFEVVLDRTARDTTNQIRLTSGVSTAGVTLDVDDVEVIVCGAVSLPGVQSIPVLEDRSLNGNQALLVGMVPVTARKRWRVVGRTATSGNQQLLGGAVFDTERDVIDSIEQVPSTGTPTTLIGSASGGAQYKASSALAAGINPVTLVTRKVGSSAVWVNSTTADSITTTITGHRAGQ